jgi:hypothetical protein
MSPSMVVCLFLCSYLLPFNWFTFVAARLIYVSVDFSIDKVKHEVHSILSFNLTITNNVAATKIARRNTMHKNTRSILGNPSQEGKKTQPNPLLYSSRERPSPPIKPSTQL